MLTCSGLTRHEWRELVGEDDIIEDPSCLAEGEEAFILAVEGATVMDDEEDVWNRL
jgi:hypothetical protein